MTGLRFVARKLVDIRRIGLLVTPVMPEFASIKPHETNYLLKRENDSSGEGAIEAGPLTRLTHAVPTTTEFPANNGNRLFIDAPFFVRNPPSRPPPRARSPPVINTPEKSPTLEC